MKILISTAKEILSMTPKELDTKLYELRQMVVGGDITFRVLTEHHMVCQRAMELAKVQLDADFERQVEDNPRCWNVIPIGDDKTFWHNEHGLRTWVRNPDETITMDRLESLRGTTDRAEIAQRSYHWVDRVILMTNDRVVVGEMPFSEFMTKSYYREYWLPEIPKK